MLSYTSTYMVYYENQQLIVSPQFMDLACS